MTKTYVYDAFGVEKNAVASDTNPWRYCGEYFDQETGNIYLRARYYSPAIGRFTQEDPVKDGLNWYTYCNNNPIIFIDPWGLFTEDQYDFFHTSQPYRSEFNATLQFLDRINNYQLIGDEDPKWFVEEYSSMLELIYKDKNEILISKLICSTLGFSEPTDIYPNITREFGELTGNGHHLGVDIGHKGYTNTNVYSIFVGKIVHAGKSGGSGANGNIVVIEHQIGGYKFYSSYSHLKNNSISVSVNDIVFPGQLIGTMGNTSKPGTTMSTHLHLAVFEQKNETFTDAPYGYDRITDGIFNGRYKNMGRQYYDPIELIDSNGMNFQY